MIRGKTLRLSAACACAAMVLTVTSSARAANSVLLSALLPGLGQAQEGHYTKATIFGSAAIISWVGVFASQINYAQSVDKYEDEKRNLTRAQEPGNQPGLAGLGHCAGAVAVRHESNVTDDPDRVNCFFRICAAFEANAREVVRSRTPRRPDG